MWTRRLLIILGSIATLSLSGCKIPAEVIENIWVGLANLAGKTAAHSVLTHSSLSAKHEQTLPFILKQGDHYQKVQAKNGKADYYLVMRADGTIEYFTLDGVELQLSTQVENAEPEIMGINIDELRKGAH